MNTLQPENVAHGADITIQAQVAGTGYVTLAEVYEMDLDEDQGIVKMPVLGSRRTGARQGRFTVTGTIKAYWLNGAVHSMLLGNSTVTTAGQTTSIYHSQRPFQRFNIVINGLATSPTPLTVINVVFEKDTTKWTENQFSEDTITFQAEDVLGL